MSKLIFAASQAILEQQITGITNVNASSNPSYRSIAITDDGYFYTHGRKFRLYKVTSQGVEGLSLSWSNADGKLQLTDGNTVVASIDAVHTILGDSIITATRDGQDFGKYTITHAQPATSPAGSYGSAATLDTVSIPSITVDAYGHITAATGVSVDATKVKGSAIASDDNNTYSIIGVNGATIQAPKYFATTYLDKTGAIYEQGTSLANKYAAKQYATNSVNGTVLLSDATNSELNAAEGHTAATPLAVKNALTAANQYADSLFSKNDAMLLVGTVDHTGVFKSHNSDLFPSIIDNTTNITALDYKAGYTFKITDSGSLSIGDTGYVVTFTVEPGDVLLCVADKNSNIRGNDFTVIQNNIDGSVVSANALTGVLYGTGTRSISALANPESTKYLRYTVTNNEGALEWVDSSAGWRTFYNGSTSGTAIQNKNIIMTAASGNDTVNPLVITFDNTGTNGTITYTINPKAIIKGAASKLTIKQGDTKFEYDTTDAKTLNVDSILTLASSNSVWTLGHATSGVTADTTAKVRKTKIDSYGHVTYQEEVNAMSNPYALYTATGGTVVNLSYDGSARFGYNFIADTDVTITPTIRNTENGFNYESGSKTAGIDLKFGITHKYRPISILKAPVGNADPVTIDVLATATSNALVLKEGTHVTISKDANDNVEISSSWRPVSVYALNNGALAQGSLDNTSSLVFSNDFLVDNGELAIYWTEIDANGTITYSK